MARIRELRKKIGFSISRLSQEAKLNASVLSYVELGKLAASPAVRKALSKFYKQPLDELFDERGLAR